VGGDTEAWEEVENVRRIDRGESGRERRRNVDGGNHKWEGSVGWGMEITRVGEGVIEIRKQ
jgi:hypothetical protein